MASTTEVEDFERFGQLVRERRTAAGLSQEALAATALGNPDRKSFISALENNRLAKVTPGTAQKLCGPLGLSRADVPASLRWPSAEDPAPTEARLQALEARSAEVDGQSVARFINAQMEGVLRRSISDIYRERLMAGLDILRIWTGRPFSPQSALVCYALSLLYVVAAGMGSFIKGDIAIGSVRLFRSLDWTNDGLTAVLPYVGILSLGLALYACWVLIRPLGLRPIGRRETVTRLGSLALIAGLACGIADYLGTNSLVAAGLFAVPAVAGISTLSPRPAVLFGAAGGIFLGLVAAVSSFMTDRTLIAFIVSLSEGFIIGGIVGSSAGLASSLIARRMPHLRPGQLAAAGGGVGVGALVSLAGIAVASNYAAVSGGTLGFFALSWLALPMTNAAMDFVSLGVSHGLGRYILSARAVPVWLVLILDLGIALLLMILTVVVIGLALHGVTLGLGVNTDHIAFLDRSTSDPWGQGLWLTLMVLSTTVWTLLHFWLVVSPLAAGALTRHLLERPAARRLDRAREADGFDMSVGAMVVGRGVAFHVFWVAIAILPVGLVAANPQIIEYVLRTGWGLTVLLTG